MISLKQIPKLEVPERIAKVDFIKGTLRPKFHIRGIRTKNGTQVVIH